MESNIELPQEFNDLASQGSGPGDDSASLHFKPYFQPIICLSTGRVAGYEALARQVDERSGREQPPLAFFDDCVPFAMKRQWDLSVRRDALNEFSRFDESGFLSVNIFPDWLVDVQRDNIPTLTMIREANIDLSRVVMEITERDGDLDALRDLVQCYQEAGLKVAVDDFGVGASQVDRIIALRPDIIKLDMHLFKSASIGLPEADVLLSVASLAQRAGCEIICEGVETEKELHFAIECGANYVQGWLFDKALPEFQSGAKYRSEMNRYKDSYLTRKTDRHHELAVHNQLLMRQVESLRSHYSDYRGGELEYSQLDAAVMGQLGIFRIYICDAQGNQVSANLDIIGGVVRKSRDRRVYNWSHRPYFPLLHAVSRMGLDHVVASDPYRDILTETMCKTFGCFISDQYVMLVDAFVDDAVLFKHA